jgi:hypothetical protein
MRLAITVAIAALLVLPGTAAASDIKFELKTDTGVRFGSPHRATGTLTDDAGAPAAGQAIELQARPFPYKGSFKKVATAKTGADGRFTFKRVFDRDVELRAVAAALSVTSVTRHAYVFPRIHLSFEQLSGGRLRLIQTLRTPKDVRLSAPVIFYLGSGNAKTAPPTAKAKPRRTAPGRFRASAKVMLPKAWKGSFRYGSCFKYSRGSGMGDPNATCPTRYRF